MTRRYYPHGAPWSDRRVERLKKMWSDGKSYGEIADDLGGTTRQAVSGKIFRLGLPKRGATKTQPETVETAQ